MTGGIPPRAPGPAAPLAGRCILLTREDEGGALPSRLEFAGAMIRQAPLVRTLPVDDPAPLTQALLALEPFEWVALTSSRAVEALATHLPPGETASIRERLRRLRWGCVGPATAQALRARLGIDAEVVPSTYNAASLADSMLGAGVHGTVLFPAAEGARPDLPARLRDAGVEVRQIVAYRTVPAVPRPEELEPPAGHDHWDAVAFTSGTAVKVLLESLCRWMSADGARSWLRRNGPAVLGGSAEETLRQAGVEPRFRAGHATTEALAEAIIAGLSGAGEESTGSPEEERSR